MRSLPSAVAMIRTWWRRLTGLGAHSRRGAGAFGVWEILLSSPAGTTGYIPAPAGRHRPDRVDRAHRVIADLPECKKYVRKVRLSAGAAP